MTIKKSQFLFLQTRDWHELRMFLVRRKWLRDAIEPEVYDAVCDGETRNFSYRLMRELAVYVAGYIEGKASIDSVG